jgi:hypothetical protein
MAAFYRTFSFTLPLVTGCRTGYRHPAKKEILGRGEV